MNAPTLFSIQIWLIDTIYRSRKISFHDLNELWLRTEMSGGVEMARSSFNRNRAMVEDVFGVVIECDRHDGNRYYIVNEDVLKGPSMNKWLFDTVGLSKFFIDNIALRNRILFDEYYEDEEGLRIITQAMKENKKVAFVFSSDIEGVAHDLVFAPYTLKCVRHNWYLMGLQDDGRFGLVPLRLMDDLRITDEEFVYDTSFSDSDFVEQCYGCVSKHSLQPACIVLRAKGNLRKVLKEFRLHSSQRVIAETDTYTDFELTVVPSINFVRGLMVSNKNLEVVSPQWLTDCVKNIDDKVVYYNR